MFLERIPDSITNLRRIASPIDDFLVYRITKDGTVGEIRSGGDY